MTHKHTHNTMPNHMTADAAAKKGVRDTWPPKSPTQTCTCDTDKSHAPAQQELTSRVVGQSSWPLHQGVRLCTTVHGCHTDAGITTNWLRHARHLPLLHRGNIRKLGHVVSCLTLPLVGLLLGATAFFMWQVGARERKELSCNQRVRSLVTIVVAGAVHAIQKPRD